MTTTASDLNQHHFDAKGRYDPEQAPGRYERIAGSQQDHHESNAEENGLASVMVPFLAVPMIVSLYFAYDYGRNAGPAFFALHPISEMTAITLLAASIMYQRINPAANSADQNVRRQILFAVLALLIASFGFYVVYTTKNEYDKPHFLTIHSHLGLFSFSAVTLYAIVSYTGFNPMTGWGKDSTRAKRLHRNIGQVIVMVGLITAAFGILELESLRAIVPNAIVWIGSLLMFTPVVL